MRKLFKINNLLSENKDSEYYIRNLDTNTFRASDIAYTKEVVIKIQALDFVELVEFLEFHFNDLPATLKVKFLQFIHLYILDNDDIKTNYRDTIKKWYSIKDVECAIYKKDDPIFNWNKMVWNYEAFFIECDFDFGIEQLSKELIDLKSDPIEKEYKEKKKEIEIKIQEASERHKEKVRTLYNEKVKEQFGTTCHRAEQELNRLLVNEKYDFLKSTVRPELLKIETEFMRLVKKFKMNNSQNMGYMNTFLQLNYFSEIKYWFDNVVLNFIEPPKIELEKEETLELLDLDGLDLKTQKEQIILLYELGIINFLREKYPNSLGINNNELSKIIANFLKLKSTSLQPTINALLTDTADNKNYPSETKRTKEIITRLNVAESI